MRIYTLAIDTQASKFQAVLGNLEARFSRNPFINLFINRLIQIEHPTAHLTPEVIVVLGVGIEPAEATGQIQLKYLPFLFQQPEVTIDRSQTYIGYFLSHLLIYPVRRGMRCCTP